MAIGVWVGALVKPITQVDDFKNRQDYCTERGESDRVELNAKSSGEKPELCGYKVKIRQLLREVFC